MEYFLVFLLGIALAVVILFLLRPGFFSRPSADFSLIEAVFEDALAELEKRQAEFLEQIERQRADLLELQRRVLESVAPAGAQSPKVLAVLQLAEAEHDVAAIAKKLGLGIGEVELVLELNRAGEDGAEEAEDSD